VDSKLVRFQSVRRETGASYNHAQIMRGTSELGQYKGELRRTNIRCRRSGVMETPRTQLRLPCTWQTCKKVTRQNTGSSPPHLCDINSGVPLLETYRTSPPKLPSHVWQKRQVFRHKCSSLGASLCHSSYWIPAIWLEHVDAMPYCLLGNTTRNLKLKSWVNDVLRNTHTSMRCPAETELLY
jgi:hypothetical protein